MIDVDIEVTLVRSDEEPPVRIPYPGDDATPEIAADWLRREITARMFEDMRRVDTLTVDDMYGPDGRLVGATPYNLFNRDGRPVRCEWCGADYYTRAGRCARCNEPWYDGALFYPGPSTATATPCPLRFGGGAARSMRYLSVARRMCRHRGDESAWALEVDPQLHALDAADELAATPLPSGSLHAVTLTDEIADSQ